jgi:hypothetical protein
MASELYSNGKWIMLPLVPDEHMATILFDMIDKKVQIPMKRQGYLDMYKGIDMMQTKTISKYLANC